MGKYYVYAIRAGDTDAVKIGITSDIGRRLSGMQTDNHELLSVVETIEFNTREEASGLEAHLHTYWRSEGYHNHHEWFNIPIDVQPILDIKAAVRYLENTTALIDFYNEGRDKVIDWRYRLGVAAARDFLTRVYGSMDDLHTNLISVEQLNKAYAEWVKEGFGEHLNRTRRGLKLSKNVKSSRGAFKASCSLLGLKYNGYQIQRDGVRRIEYYLIDI